MTKRGTWRLPFLPNWHIVSKAHQQNARFFKRLAPQKWCVQFWCSSKPGGVMFPPELVELTSFLYSQKLLDAREKLANPPTLPPLGARELVGSLIFLLRPAISGSTRK